MSTPPFRWSAKREEAAMLVARDDLTNAEIAGRVGVSRRTLDKWKAHPDFAARVTSIVEEAREAALARGVAHHQARIAAIDERWRHLLAIVKARGEEMADVPGGHTGLLVRRTRRVALTAEPADTPERTLRRIPVYDYQVDTGLLRELRSLEDHAARQLGQLGTPPEDGPFDDDLDGSEWSPNDPPLEPDWPPETPSWRPPSLADSSRLTAGS